MDDREADDRRITAAITTHAASGLAGRAELRAIAPSCVKQPFQGGMTHEALAQKTGARYVLDGVVERERRWCR